MFWLKIKAGALQVTLFVAIVIALLLTAFIMLVHTHKTFSIQMGFIVEASKNSNKGICYSLNHQTRLNDTVNIPLNDEDYKSLKTYRAYWGIFEKVTSIASIKNKTLKRVALIGAKQEQIHRTALYIQDNNKPLVVVGETKIEGVAYLPERGVKPGNISGQSYYGNQLIYGQTKKSSILPKPYHETLNQIENISQQINTIDNDQFIILEQGKTYQNSFLQPKQVLYSNNNIQLSDVKLIGHIVIRSKTKIIVDKTSVLKDVIIIAPEIEILDDVKGNFQAIATKNITIGKRVELSYPTALILNEDETLLTSENKNDNKIVINDYSTVKGVVLFSSQPKTNNFNPQIELTEQAKVIGEVYCTENIELKGTVYGSIFTNNFITREAGSIYQNHIYNGMISVKQLPIEYVGLSFEDSKKGILKWLY